jgi:hypothetical protein
MKKNIKFNFIIVILIINFLYNNAQDDIKFYFPKDWNKVESTYKKNRLLQISDSILETINISDLINVCLSYPYFIEVFFNDNIQEGFNSVRKNFNGIEELMKRNGICQSLFNKYLTIEVFNENIKSYSLVEKGNYAFRLFYLELLLSQDSILIQFSKPEREILFQKCINTLNEKQKYPEIYGSISFSSSCLLLARLLKYESELFNKEINNNLDIEEFIFKPKIISDDIIDIILIHSYNYVNNL